MVWLTSSKKAMSCVYRVGQRFGIRHVIDVMRGADTERIRLFGHGGLSTYFGNTFKRVQWLGISRIRQIGEFYFITYERDTLPSGGFPKSAISDEALELLRATGKLIEQGQWRRGRGR